MSPRRYTPGKRQAARDETRRRILEATLALHAEHGILGTSWKQIARRADVSLATVYNHFPTLDELVPACGELMAAIIQPPALEDAPRIFAGARSRAARLARLAAALGDFYARGAPYLDTDHQERKLPAVQEWEAYLQSLIAGLVRLAFAPARPDDHTVRVISTLFDFPVFQAFQRRGLPQTEIAQTLTRLAISAAGRPRRPRRAPSRRAASNERNPHADRE